MKQKSGFTLMELMVAIAIIGILSAIAVPNVIQWRNNAQANAAARDMYSGFQMAKSEAVENNMNCTIVFDTTINEYEVFLEKPVSPNLEYDAGETVLKTVRFSEFGSVQMTGAAFTQNNAGKPAITFRPDGLPVDINGNLGGGTVSLSGATDKQIQLSNAGSVQVSNS